MDFSQKRLSLKLVWIAVGLLAVALAAIGYTLLQSWKLEGGAAVINDMGSERMRSYRIAYLLSQHLQHPDSAGHDELLAEMDRLEQVHEVLQRGDPSRPLALPREAGIQENVRDIGDYWAGQLRPRIANALIEPNPDSRAEIMRWLRPDIDAFVSRIDQVVSAVERRNAYNTELLRYMQLGLVALAVAGTVTLIYLMFMLVVRPVEKLSEGMQRMTRGEFDVRLPVETQDEFGALADGFNRMAEHLQDLYHSLEGRVASKTHSLEEKNRELAMLYDVATLLNTQSSTTESLCRTFLQKLMAMLGAQAGAVRLIDPKTRDIHMYVHEGLSDGFARDEQCIDMGHCFCGEAALHEKSLVELMSPARADGRTYPCHQAGYRTVSIIPIRFRTELLGIYNLYFARPRMVSTEERRMLETLGDNLGVAIENQRLISRVREMAASEERTLLAQELHDSIAQSLAFLNIEAQMLEDALREANAGEAREILAQIRLGIKSSYDDVRELLVHFRTRIKTEDLGLTIKVALERFAAQTGIEASFDETGSAMPISPERHLQVLHILQEALSNVRKHAGATAVTVTMQRGPVYRFSVHDNGKGFDLGGITVKGEGHIGLKIMRERAQRIGGEVDIESRPGAGTTVTLQLPVARDEAAAVT
jgi:two-component system nitrate/nitrite sensor histidine kinase NarX